MMTTIDTPDISVCIANYNGGDLVLACIDSVLSQQGSFTLEILVHDDLSSDGSVALIRARHPEIRIIQSESNVGFCVSNNRMADAASGRYLLLLNNDAVLRLGSLSALLGYAENGHDDCVLGLPQCAMTNGSLVDCGYKTDPFLNPIPVFSIELHEVGVATGACLWVPRKTWKRIGGFPPWFESVAEDIYLCMAARLLGHRVVVLDGPAFDHWIGKNLGGGKLIDQRLHTTTRRRALSERNKTLAMLCCYPGAPLLLLLPTHAFFLICEATFLLLTGMPAARIREIYANIPRAIWANRSAIYALRKKLMAQRKAKSTRFFAFTVWLPSKLLMLLRHGLPTVK